MLATFSHHPWIHIYSGLITEIVTVFVIQVYSERLQGLYYSKILSEMISKGLEIQHFPAGGMLPDPPRWCTCTHNPWPNQYVAYNLCTGLTTSITTSFPALYAGSYQYTILMCLYCNTHATDLCSLKVFDFS